MVASARYRWGKLLYMGAVDSKLKLTMHEVPVIGDWCNVPIVVKNQRLFNVNPMLCRKLSQISTKLHFFLQIK